MAEKILDRVVDNINAVTQDPAAALDQRLLEEGGVVLPDSFPTEDLQSLVISLSQLLPNLQQDPSPAVNLLLRLVNEYTFSDVLNLGNIPFAAGLSDGEHMVSFNRLILALLQKATKNSADAASLASMLDTVHALVRLWLCTTDTGIASQSSQLLLDLLKVDQEVHTDPEGHLPDHGQGLLWKRIFGDRDVYRTFFDACSLFGPSEIKLSKSQRTLAQARFMEWLPKVGAMDWTAIARSHHSEVETEFDVQGGLLDFAALNMVDLKDDVLMHRCLIDFYTDLLSASAPNMRVTGSATDSVGLRYLITQGLHARTSALYLQLPGTQLDPLDSMFLYGPAANYIAVYASQYPEHFMTSQMSTQIMEHLRKALDISPAKWAHAESPKHDLHLVASLPRRAILNTSGGASWTSSPLSLLPSKATNPDVLNSLAIIFHGPNRKMVNFPRSEKDSPHSNEVSEEAPEARALYYHYVSHNPRFWRDIAMHADTVALKDNALAALNCLKAVITANWFDQPELPLPTTIATPEEGYMAILTPPALEYTLPYLLKPPQTFANLVGGRGDAESAAYKIALAKFDALGAFSHRLAIQVEKQPGQGFEEILATINKRLTDGPLNREGEVGGHIGTLEL